VDAANRLGDDAVDVDRIVYYWSLPVWRVFIGNFMSEGVRVVGGFGAGVDARIIFHVVPNIRDRRLTMAEVVDAPVHEIRSEVTPVMLV